MGDTLEHEKTKSYELGQISERESIAEDLRERSGELYANDSRADTKKAKHLKSLAKEYEESAQTRREHWDEKYDE